MTLLDIFFRQNFKVEVSAPVIEMLKRDIYESKYSQYAEWKLHKIQKAMNGTFARLKFML